MAEGHQISRILTAFAAVVVWTTTAVAEPVVSALRLGIHAEKTRIVVDLSDPVPFSIGLLANPYRVVIELPNVLWRVGSGASAKRGLVESFTFVPASASQTRIVLTVAGPVRINQSFVLPPGEVVVYRLVVDISETTSKDFRATAVQGSVESGARNEARVTAPSPARKSTPERTTAKPLRRVIVLDPGHGGIDPGAISASGLYEKNLTLQFARELKVALEATGSIRAVLTREGDIFLRLRERIKVARAINAQLFISIHADSINDKGLRGASVYTLSETASDEEAAALAQRENRVDVIAGLDLTGEHDDVTNILIDLTQRESMNLSARYAGILVGELRKTAPLLRRSHRFAGFAVLKAPDVPSVLVELGYLSNGEDEKTLATRAGRKNYVDAIARAIDLYFAEARVN
ncbi:MAG: N-acetylmuramoyl-L-alanine amidase [Alphaproteobacteria bacterium]|nr:N-acetylmuramoyl-L-alanine amidase [Alphaproteobacteria bacterium]